MKLLTFSNYIPEQIGEVTRFVDYAGLFRMPHCCQYVQNFIAYGMEQNNFDGIVFPNSCDGARTAIDYMDKSKKYVYQLKHPTIVSDDSCAYFAAALETYKCSLEQYFQKPIDIGDILEKTTALAERGKYLHDLYENSLISDYADYCSQINQMLQKPLLEWKKYAPKGNAATKQGKKVYVIGSFLDHPALLAQIECCGMKIVGDNLTNSKRLMWDAYTFSEKNIFKDMATHILRYQASPTVENFATLWEKDSAEIKEKNIRGVIFVCQKFCEPYDYLYALYQQRLQEMGIPTLCVRVDNSDEGNLSVLETFADIL